VVAKEAVVAVLALPTTDALIVEVLIHFPAVVLYAKGCKLVGPDIDTSDKPAKVCVITDPPPPDPPTDLNRPPGMIEKSLAEVNTPVPFIITAPRYIAFAAVLGASTKDSTLILAIASTSVVYMLLP
jgi:hypothetical protein